MIETHDHVIEHANKAKTVLHHQAVSAAAAATKAAQRIASLERRQGGKS